MQLTQINLVSIPVTDQQVSKRFYTEVLGLALLRESPMWPGADWIQVGPAGAQTSFTLVTWFESMPPGSLRGVVMETPDVDAAFAELGARAAWPAHQSRANPGGSGPPSRIPTATNWCYRRPPRARCAGRHAH